MADMYEFSMAMDLRDDISEEEIAELRWHLGLGPQPVRLTVVREFPVVMEDDQGELVTEDVPVPLLGCHDTALKVGGALTSVLLRRKVGWALTARQEIHPDDFDRVGELLTWLAAKACGHHERFDGSVRVGWFRFYEEEQLHPLAVRDGGVEWPS
ncbi:hypothetical protein ACFQ0X_05970 [Streptomyces rectiviolaceus]|uniref:Uncharacterized protein n=1 Tax=Streptomyces rectiviolaceus TaxID=332591 RepID=A0ABP6NHY7_9ACTN